jgi:hypothetical protein
MAEKLGWGAAHLVPAEAPAAWGARLIVMQSGDVDMVGNRQHAIGSEQDIDKLLGHLNGGANKVWMAKLGDMLRAREVRVDVGAEVVVYEDDLVKVAGNSNGSHGYFYVAAWLR